MKLAPGCRFRNLEIESMLARGSFATVFQARDRVIGRPVVLKVLPRRENGSGVSALREARLLGGLRSAHIVALYQVHAIDADRWGLEMEYVDGGSLETLLETHGRLAPADAAAVLRGLLRALRVAHRHGVLHRDVKPGNVLLGLDGTVKLTDFGLGGRLERGAHRPNAGPSGTPLYMAPEILEGREARVASDLWSVGVLAYHMLAGRPPFDGGELADVLAAVRAAEPAPLDERVPPTLSRWVMHCLERDPSARPTSSRAALEALDAACRRPVDVDALPRTRTEIGGRRTVNLVISDLRRATAAQREGRAEEALRLARAAQAAAARLGHGWLLETAKARLARRARDARTG